MRRRTILIAAAMVLTAGAAAAAAARLSAAEARGELFGVELIGVIEGAGDSWRECIEPGGRTMYQRGQERREGRLTIREDGQACFTYHGDDFSSCFAVGRERGGNYRFDAFATQSVRRGVRQCSARALIS